MGSKRASLRMGTVVVELAAASCDPSPCKMLELPLVDMVDGSECQPG